jgi:hypothetical protein
VTSPNDDAAPRDEARVRTIDALDLVLALLVASIATALVLIDRFVVPAFASVYQEFGSGSVLPGVTRVVIGHAAPLGGAAAAVVLAALGVFARRKGSGGLALGLLLAGVALGLATVAFCFYGLYAPMFELAGKIKA